MATFLEAENLVAGHGAQHTVRNFDFKASQGTIVVLTGNNGCGKSTLLKTFVADIPPINGHISFSGSSTPHFQNISWLPQKVTLNFSLPVLEVVKAGALMRTAWFNTYSDADNKAAEDLLQKFGLDSIKTKDFLDLSGGQQQIVLICQTLHKKSKYVFLDEPQQNLDVYYKRLLLEILQIYAEENQAIIMFSTHDISSLTCLNLTTTQVLHIETDQTTAYNTCVSSLTILEKALGKQF